ncbi:MAG: hypothetical protein QXV22_03970 [Thermoplasmataceae archaeon]
MNLESGLSKGFPEFQRIDYAEVDHVSSRQEKRLGIPTLHILARGKEIEYKPMHDKHAGIADLDDDSFSRYAQLITKAFGEKASVEQ